MLGPLVHLLRLARVGFVLAREGALVLAEPAPLPPLARFGLRMARLIERGGAGDEADRLAAALTRLGPSWVKFGQFLATRPDVVGVRVARDLETLQDRMAPFPRQLAEQAVAEAFGKPVDQVFSQLGDAVAAASIAQVHAGQLHAGQVHAGQVHAGQLHAGQVHAGEVHAGRLADGQVSGRVAVKVLRPGIRARFERDLADMRFAARMAERYIAASRRLRPMEVVETLVRSVTMEMDLRLEAAALSELAENTRDDPGFRVPKVFWEFTARDVLTSEWIDGIALSDLAAIEAAGHDRVALSRAIIQSFLRQALRDGFFHADMHPGNLFVDAAGQLVAVDCGIMGRLGWKERRFLAEILLGFITRDYRRVAEVHFEAGYVPGRYSVADFAQALRSVGEPIHDRRADEISMAKLLTLLFEITGLFDMTTRTELVMLQKTMVVVEGVGRTLDPKLDMWSTSEPVVREWIERNLGPVGRIEEAGRGALALAGFVGHLPALLARGERLAEKLERAADSGFALHAESVEAIGLAEARRSRWGHIALWVIAALFVSIVVRGGF